MNIKVSCEVETNLCLLYPPPPSVLFMSSIREFDRKFGQAAMKCDKKETLEIYFQYESNNLTFVTYNSIFKNVRSMFY